MCKSLVTITAALAIMFLGSLLTGAQAGGATSAPSKYNNVNSDCEPLSSSPPSAGATCRIRNHRVFVLFGEALNAPALI